MIIEDVNFDLDFPVCLYCGATCYISSTSSGDSVIDTYHCEFCNESFIIFYKEDEQVSFEFTCYNYSVLIHKTKDTFQLLSTNCGFQLNRYINWHQIINQIKVPKFTIDFSNKQKLYEKLHTYAIFS